MNVQRLDPGTLRWRCDPNQFDFRTTDELQGDGEVLGQERALEAVRFGIGIRHEGYNLYVLGQPGAGKRTVVERFLERTTEENDSPPDWCYVEDFSKSNRPQALCLPAGRGGELREDMANLIEDLKSAIPAALELQEHQARIEEIQREAQQHHDETFQQLAKKALSRGIQLVRTPSGFGLAPVRDGEVLAPEEFEKLPEEEQNKIEASVRELEAELAEIVEQVPFWRKQTRDKVKALNQQVASLAIGHSLAQIKQKYAELPEVVEYLVAVERDLAENADDFAPSEQHPAVALGLSPPEQQSFQRYQVNLLVDNSAARGAPVVFEDHPNYHNLLGRVEHKSHMGTLVTDFTLIRAGALHRANGGYLIVDSLRMLQQPYAWEGLKRALLAREMRIESLGEALSLVSPVSLEPEPIPLDVKVILLGDRLLYYMLYQHDRDFAELFKVAADFEDEIDRSPKNCRLYATLVATLARRDGYRPFDTSAVARVIEYAARASDDSEKLTTHMRTMTDLLGEADYWASLSDSKVVGEQHVQQAIEKQIARVDRVRDQVQQQIQRGMLLIDTRGAMIGRVNGLSILDLGNFRFGRPSRITATTRLGKGDVVDIEREVELGGAVHSKGVLILSSFLAARYAKNHPLSLSASLVFEQSYGLVDGDSASAAELCALLSSLAEIPIRQSLAITGSVNQHGEIQPIGGVNEKIEGFFDVCRSRGLTGEQGVLVPASNVKQLMLRHDVVRAAEEGRFHVYPVDAIDQAASLLTGVPSGGRDEQGKYPEGTINQLVESRLLTMFELRKNLAAEEKSEKPHG